MYIYAFYNSSKRLFFGLLLIVILNDLVKEKFLKTESRVIYRTTSPFPPSPPHPALISKRNFKSLFSTK